MQGRGTRAGWRHEGHVTVQQRQQHSNNTSHPPVATSGLQQRQRQRHLLVQAVANIGRAAAPAACPKPPWHNPAAACTDGTCLPCSRAARCRRAPAHPQPAPVKVGTWHSNHNRANMADTKCLVKSCSASLATPGGRAAIQPGSAPGVRPRTVAISSPGQGRGAEQLSVPITAHLHRVIEPHAAQRARHVGQCPREVVGAAVRAWAARQEMRTAWEVLPR